MENGNQIHNKIFQPSGRLNCLAYLNFAFINSLKYFNGFYLAELRTEVLRTISEKNRMMSRILLSFSNFFSGPVYVFTFLGSILSHA